LKRLSEGMYELSRYMLLKNKKKEQKLAAGKGGL
jgi:hypothetical protein